MAGSLHTLLRVTDEIIEHARLKEYVASMPGKLGARINEGGECCLVELARPRSKY